MERPRNKTNSRIVRLVLPLIGAALLFAGCGMFDGGEAEVKVDFGQYGNEGGGQGSENESQDKTGGSEENSDQSGGEDGENDSQDSAGGLEGGGDSSQDGSKESGQDKSTEDGETLESETSEEQKKQMEDFYKSALAEELLAYLKENGREDDAFSEPIFDSANKIYSKEELEQLSDAMCRIFRNEIYARHGMIFGNEDLNRIYSAFSWYEGTIGLREFEAQKELPFNDTENKNLSNVIAVEKARKNN